MNARNTLLYEQDTLRKVTGETVRPGGYELTQRAIAFCSLWETAKILDVACGTGASVQWLREKQGFQVVGLDLSELMLLVGHQRCPDLPLVQGESRSLPIASEQLDAILVECSLSLMPDLASVLGELNRVMCPSGYLIASDVFLRNPQAAGLLRSLPVECCLKGAKSQAEMLGILQSQGFEIVLWEDHSESLQHLTTQLIHEYGSMQEFWCKSMPGEIDHFELQLAIARTKPGYYLLVARKIGTVSGETQSVA